MVEQMFHTITRHAGSYVVVSNNRAAIGFTPFKAPPKH